MSHPGRSDKYERLMAIRDLARVPATVLLEETFFCRAIAGYEALDRALRHLLEEILGTSGAFLGEHAAELGKLLAGLRLTAEGSRLLGAALAEIPGHDEHVGARFVVRSAAPHEDGDRRSYAGLYLSRLGLTTPADVAAAVLEVWGSFFAYPALLERLTSGTLGSGARMSVMIQPQVAARWAGVCFTADPVAPSRGMVVELVEGLGDQLVAGSTQGLRLDAAEIAAGEGPESARTALAELSVVAERLRERFGRELDLEWAWDGHRLFILQVRPISTLPAATDTPTFAWTALYGATERELDDFAPLPEFARYFRSKRGPLYRFARASGVATGEALLVRFNRAGLETAGSLEALLRCFSSPELVVDAHDSYRQRILARGEVAAELRALPLAAGEVRRVVLRDYLRGEKGIISRAVEDGTVVYEIADEGLLALNRGTAAGRRFSYEPPHPAPELPRTEQEHFYAATRAASERFGPCQLEWVLAGDRLFIVDFSPLDDPLPSGHDRRVVSPGFATGSVLRLEHDEALRRLSEGPAVSLQGIADTSSSSYLQGLLERVRGIEPKPIVAAPRPFAVLATLLPHVGGFVFERASTLCHLAILLREHGVPAIESPESYAALTSDMHVTIDARAARSPAEVEEVQR